MMGTDRFNRAANGVRQLTNVSTGCNHLLNMAMGLVVDGNQGKGQLTETKYRCQTVVELMEDSAGDGLPRLHRGEIWHKTRG